MKASRSEQKSRDIETTKPLASTSRRGLSLAKRVERRADQLLVERLAQEEAARKLADLKAPPPPRPDEVSADRIRQLEENLKSGPLSEGESKELFDLHQAQRLAERSQY
jgi:hypothetical protein